MKTLKDITICSIERQGKFYHLIEPMDLRQTAIEDIKKILLENKLEIKDIGNYERWGFTSSESALILIDYIKQKFNIEDKDLREIIQEGFSWRCSNCNKKFDRPENAMVHKCENDLNLKTLKDIIESQNLISPSGYRPDTSIVFTKELRQSAIEWWKFFKEQHDKKDDIQSQLLDRAVMSFIYDFFNLTEDDLNAK